MTRPLNVGYARDVRPGRTLGRVLSRAVHGNPSAVHQTRVLIRRCREWLPAAGGRDVAPLLVELQELRRLFGPMRELDVCTGVLEGRAVSARVSAPVVHALVREFLAERARRLADVQAAVDDDRITRLVERLDASTAAPPSARHRATDKRWRRRVRRRARRLDVAVRHASGLYLPERLHEVRIRLKKLRYALDAAADARAVRVAKRERLLVKRAQDVLGRMQDLEVTIDRVRAVQGTPGTLTLRTSRSADVLVRHLERRCRDLHARYVVLRDDLETLCRAVRHRAHD